MIGSNNYSKLHRLNSPHSRENQLNSNNQHRSPSHRCPVSLYFQLYFLPYLNSIKVLPGFTSWFGHLRAWWFPCENTAIQLLNSKLVGCRARVGGGHASNDNKTMFYRRGCLAVRGPNVRLAVRGTFKSMDSRKWSMACYSKSLRNGSKSPRIRGSGPRHINIPQQQQTTENKRK